VAIALAERRELLFVALQVPVGLVVRNQALLGTLHSLLILTLGLAWSTSQRTVHRTILAAAYVAGAEVLWRMSGGLVIYEFGKYAVALLMLAALLRLPGHSRAGTGGLLYIVLLLPSIFLTVDVLGMTFSARREISFNLSGPFALALAVLCLSRMPAGRLLLRQVVVALSAPVIGIAAVAGRSTFEASHIRFTTNSNFVTSGGFGPNQVSAVLGLGALFSILLAFTARTTLARMGFLAIAAAELIQATLTFSRGGVINSLICVSLLAVHLLRRPRVRAVVILSLLVFAVLARVVLVPQLETFTGGALGQRFGDLNPGLRQTLAKDEIGIWYRHPLLGVGPGMAKRYRHANYEYAIAAHTEYTRMLAEHGFFGFIALLILIVLPIRAYLRAPTTMTKAWVAMTAGWAMLEMLHAAMRIGAISFVYALSLLAWTAADQRRRARGYRR